MIHSDKRVDAIIKKKGYEEAQIFYSPILVRLLIFILVGSMTDFMLYVFGLIYLFDNFHFSFLIGVITIYLSSIYLIISYLNHSFALSENKLLVINPNFPFNLYREFYMTDIEKIVINENRIMSIFLFLITFGSGNYVELELKNGLKKRFYCIYLDEDYSDESYTEITIEDLVDELRVKKIKVESKY